MEEKKELTNLERALQFDVNVEELELKEAPATLNHNETLLRDEIAALEAPIIEIGFEELEGKEAPGTLNHNETLLRDEM